MLVAQTGAESVELKMVKISAWNRTGGSRFSVLLGWWSKRQTVDPSRVRASARVSKKNAAGGTFSV